MQKVSGKDDYSNKVRSRTHVTSFALAVSVAAVVVFLIKRDNIFRRVAATVLFLFLLLLSLVDSKSVWERERERETNQSQLKYTSTKK